MSDKFLTPIDIAQTDDTTPPPAGHVRLQAKTNGSLVSRNPAGVETTLGSAAGSVTMSSQRLTTTQANSTVTPAVLTGFTFTIPPGKTALIDAILIFQAAATTTGGALGIRVAQGAGANANAVGAWNIDVALSGAAAATSLTDGDVYNVAAGANGLGEVLGTAVSATATNHYAIGKAIVKNNSTNVNTTVTIEFRSEVAGSAVTAQIGTSANVVIA